MDKPDITYHDAIGVVDMPFKSTHRHLKTGGLYRFLGTCRIAATCSAGVIYDNAEGVVFVCDKAEFEDGRFVSVTEEENATD